MKTIEQGTTAIEAGAIMRHQVRVLLNQYALGGATFREEKTLLSSHFTVYGPVTYLREIDAAIHRVEQVRHLILIERKDKRKLKKLAEANNVTLTFEKLPQRKLMVTAAGARYRVLATEEAWEELKWSAKTS